jgi:hypothetical protein
MVFLAKNLAICNMSNEIFDFSTLIDQQFVCLEEPAGGFLSFLLSFFR